MKLVNGKIEMERKDCSRCDTHGHERGKVCGKKPCPKCQGTGKGARGKANGCKTCYGGRTQPDWVNMIPCPRCQGQWQGAEEENSCDTLPDAIFQAIPIRIYRSQREQTGNEYLIGLGCLYSVTDYGRSQSQPDQYFIDSIRSHTGTQAIKVIMEDGTLCDHLGVFTHLSGYSVRPVFSTNAVVEQLRVNLETRKAEYMLTGAIIAEQGGNGTVQAIHMVR